MKKAMELSVLCDCQIAVIVFSGDKLYQYSSSDLYGMMQRVMTHEGPYESATNADFQSKSTENPDESELNSPSIDPSSSLWDRKLVIDQNKAQPSRPLILPQLQAESTAVEASTCSQTPSDTKQTDEGLLKKRKFHLPRLDIPEVNNTGKYGSEEVHNLLLLSSPNVIKAEPCAKRTLYGPVEPSGNVTSPASVVSQSSSKCNANNEFPNIGGLDSSSFSNLPPLLEQMRNRSMSPNLFRNLSPSIFSSHLSPEAPLNSIALSQLLVQQLYGVASSNIANLAGHLPLHSPAQQVSTKLISADEQELKQSSATQEDCEEIDEDEEDEESEDSC